MCKNGCCRLSPIYLLVFLTLINILIYVDRGILSALASTLEDSSSGLGLRPIEIGAIGSVFMLGFMVAGPIFAHYSQSQHPLTLISIGLLIWALSTLGVGFSRNFWELLFARAFSGVGEASFVSIAPPYILDNAPESRRSTWIAIFYSAISIGYAIGYIVGNLLCNLLGGWYWPFYIEGIAILPFVIISLLAKKDDIFNHKNSNKESTKVIGAKNQIKILGSNLVYVFLVLGFTAFIFTIGGFAFWGPYIIEKLYNIPNNTATLDLGIIVIIAGVFGTIIGSLILDYIIRKDNQNYKTGLITEEKLKQITTEYANLMLFINTFIALGIAIAGIFVNIYIYFISACGIAYFFLFL